MTTRLRSHALLAVLLLAAAPVGLAGGVHEHESGSIQTDAVGQSIWTANADSRSVSHIDAASRHVSEYPPDACTPQGISVRDDGAGCAATQARASGRLAMLHAPAAGGRSFLVGASSPCGGNLGASTTGLARSLRFSACAP